MFIFEIDIYEGPSKYSRVSIFRKDDLMANYTKGTKVYTKAQIIHRLSRRVRVRRSLVEKIYNGLELPTETLMCLSDFLRESQ